MHCVLAVEKEVAEVIKNNLVKIEQFVNWQFDICEHSWQLDDHSRRNPDILVLSRYLPEEEPVKLLKDIKLMFPGSHIVLLVGTVDETCKGYLRVARQFGLYNYVTGKLPGDRPYTLLVALTDPRDPSEEPAFILNDEPVANQIEEPVPNLFERSDVQPTELPVAKNSVIEPPYRSNPMPPKSHVPTRSSMRQAPHQTHTEHPPARGYGHQDRGMPHIRRYDDQGYNPGRDNDYGRMFYENEKGWHSRTLGRLILSTANKGGVGKTTTAITLAVALARAEIDVALVDLDFAGPDIRSFFKVNTKGIETLAGRGKGAHIVLEQVITTAPGQTNLYLLTGPADETIPPGTIFSQNELAEVINVLQERFPVVIADTPPNFWNCPWLPEVFQLADLALAVVDQSSFSEADTATYAPYLLKMGVHPENIRIVLNKFSPKLHNAKIVEKAFCAGFKKNVDKNKLPRVVATIPNDWDAHIKHGYQGKTVGLEDARSQWHRIAEEIAQMVGHNYSKPGRNAKKKGFLGLFKKRGVTK